MRADSCAMRAVTCWAGPGEMGGFQIEGAPALLESGARDSFSRDNEPMDWDIGLRYGGGSVGGSAGCVRSAGI